MSLSRTVQSMIFRGEVKKVDDGANVQGIQTSGLGGYIDDAEHVQPYGFRSRAFAGAQTVVARLGAVGALVSWIFDGRYKVALEEGEVAIFDDQGQKVHLKRDGIQIAAKSGTKITLDNDTDVTGKIAATSDVTAQGMISAAMGFICGGDSGLYGTLTITKTTPLPAPPVTVTLLTVVIVGGIVKAVIPGGAPWVVAPADIVNFVWVEA